MPRSHRIVDLQTTQRGEIFRGKFAGSDFRLGDLGDPLQGWFPEPGGTNAHAGPSQTGEKFRIGSGEFRMMKFWTEKIPGMIDDALGNVHSGIAADPQAKIKQERCEQQSRDGCERGKESHRKENGQCECCQHERTDE